MGLSAYKGHVVISIILYNMGGVLKFGSKPLADLLNSNVTRLGVQGQIKVNLSCN